MKIAIIYFSGTGNTKWAGCKIKESLLKDNEVNIYSVEDPVISDKDSLITIIKESDHLILGYPVYASRMPEPINKIVNNFPKLEDKKNVSVFATQATASGDGAVYFKNELKQKGYLLTQSVHLKMGNNFYIPHLKISPVKGKKHLNKLNQNALIKIKKFCSTINSSTRKNVIVNPLGKLLGVGQRAFYSKTVEIVSKDLKVNNRSCNRCEFCVKKCPVKNIKLSDNEITFKNNCIACVRCYNFCPQKAILLGDKTIDNSIFYRYKGPEKTPYNL